jgi:hypothetical protein
MKKSLIAIAVSAAVALPAIASADVTLSGDSRARTHSIETKIGSSSDTVEASSDSRVRLKIDAKGDGYYMHSRLKYNNGTMGSSKSAVAADYAWIGVELGPVTLEGGRLDDNWGNRLYSWDVPWDGWQALFSAGAVDIAIWRSTNSEGGTYEKKLAADPGKSDADNITWGADFTGKAGMGNWGLRLTSDSLGKGASAASKAVSGNLVDAFYRGQVGPGMLLFEGIQESGDYWKDGDGDNPQAVYLHWIHNLGKYYYQVAGAQTSNHFVADGHMAPFSTVGTANDTAVMNLGGGGGFPALKSMQVIALFGGMQIMPMTNLQLGVGSITAKAAKGAKDAAGTAIDVQLTHNISKSAKIAATYGTVHMDKKLMGVKLDVVSMGARAEIKF